MTDYPFVFRHNGPLKGQLCRVIRRADVQHDQDGAIIWSDGEHLVAVEFQDGTRQIVARQAIVHATSRPGRAAVRVAARPPVRRRTRSEAQFERQARERGETTP